MFRCSAATSSNPSNKIKARPRSSRFSAHLGGHFTSFHPRKSRTNNVINSGNVMLDCLLSSRATAANTAKMALASAHHAAHSPFHSDNSNAEASSSSLIPHSPRSQHSCSCQTFAIVPAHPIFVDNLPGLPSSFSLFVCPTHRKLHPQRHKDILQIHLKNPFRLFRHQQCLCLILLKQKDKNGIPATPDGTHLKDSRTDRET